MMLNFIGPRIVRLVLVTAVCTILLIGPQPVTPAYAGGCVATSCGNTG